MLVTIPSASESYCRNIAVETFLFFSCTLATQKFCPFCRVDDLVKSMYTPSDSKQIEEKYVTLAS